MYRATVRLCHRDSESRALYKSDVTADDYERIKGRCIEALQNGLPQECKKLGLPVYAAESKRTDSGSLEILFTTLRDLSQLAGGAVALYEAARLAGSLAVKLLEKAAVDGGELGRDRALARGLQADVSCRPVFPSWEQPDGGPWICVRAYDACGPAFRGGCGSCAGMRTAVLALGVAVVVLAAALAWLACGSAG